MVITRLMKLNPRLPVGVYTKYLEKGIEESKEQLDKLASGTGVGYYVNGAESGDFAVSLAKIEGALAERLGVAGDITENGIKKLIELQMGGYDDGKTRKESHIQNRRVVSAEYVQMGGERHKLTTIEKRKGFFIHGGEKVTFTAKEVVKEYAQERFITITRNDGAERDITVSEADIAKGIKRLGKRVINLADHEIKTRDQKEQRRNTAYEIIFTTEKSITLLLANAGQPLKNLILKAIQEAKDDVLRQELHPLLKAEVNKQGEEFIGGEFMTASFTHFDNRHDESERYQHIIPAHLNIHNIIPNMIRTADGEVRAMDFRGVLTADYNKTLDAIFHSELSKRLQGLGVAFEQYNSEGKTIAMGKPDDVKGFRVAYTQETHDFIKSHCEWDKLIKAEIEKLEKAQDEKHEQESRRNAKEFKDGKIGRETYLAQDELLKAARAAEWEGLHSSKRRQAIKNKLKSEKKNEPLAEQLQKQANWLAGKGLDKINGQLDSATSTLKDHTDEEILERLLETTNRFTVNELVECVAKYRPSAGLGARAEAERILASELVLKINTSKNLGAEKILFTSRKQYVLEKDNLETARRVWTSQMDPSRWTAFLKERELNDAIGAIAKQINGFKPTQEQVDYARLLAGKGRLVAVQGVAGAGKTTAARLAKEIMDGRGMEMIGLAPTNKVASALREDLNLGYADTIHAFINDFARGKVKSGANTCILVDEAGMVDAQTMNGLLKIAEASGCKLALVGDYRQISPVSSGAPFADIVRRIDKGGLATLANINRQKTEFELGNARMLSGADVLDDLREQGLDSVETLRRYDERMEGGEAVLKALDNLDAAGKLHRFDAKDELFEQLVEDYLDDAAPWREKIIVASTNASVDRVNSEIHERRAANGELGRAATVFNSKCDRQTIAEGDRVIVTANDKKKGVYNGETGAVLSITETADKLEIRIQLDSGKEKTVSTKNGKTDCDLRLAYAVTTHKSQGVTVTNTYHVAEKSKVNSANIFYVNATRCRNEHREYVVEEDYEKVKEQFLRNGANLSLLDCEVLGTAPDLEQAEDGLEALKAKRAAVPELPKMDDMPKPQPKKLRPFTEAEIAFLDKIGRHLNKVIPNQSGTAPLIALEEKTEGQRRAEHKERIAATREEAAAYIRHRQVETKDDKGLMRELSREYLIVTKRYLERFIDQSQKAGLKDIMVERAKEIERQYKTGKIDINAYDLFTRLVTPALQKMVSLDISKLNEVVKKHFPQKTPNRDESPKAAAIATPASSQDGQTIEEQCQRAPELTL